MNGGNILGVRCAARTSSPSLSSQQLEPRATVGRFTALHASPPRHTSPPLNNQLSCRWRGIGRANAFLRRTTPVTIQLADSVGRPALRHGERERNGNIVTMPASFTPHRNMLADDLQPVTPVRPVAGYIGGKRNLSRRIVDMIGAVPHTAYAEPFVGMGGIFLRRTARPSVEIINDWSEDVSTFFRVLQHHYVAFLDMIRFQISSRAGFEKLLALDPASLTDLQRSARFLYLQRLAFGGKVAGRSFGVAPSSPARFDLTKLTPMLEALHERLSGVVIERLHWADFIARYDRAGTLFFLDPPYYGCENDYGTGLFRRDDFTRMASVLSALKGRFILSVNDVPALREIFAQFSTTPIETTYSVGGMDRAKRVGELVISNL